MNAISALYEGSEAGKKAEEMRLSYIRMLNDYSNFRKILDALKTDALARENEDLENAVDNIISVLDATYVTNVGTYFDATTRVIDETGNQLATSTEAGSKTALISFGEKSAQTLITKILDRAITKGTGAAIGPLAIASISAKIVQGISNYDEVFDDSTELATMSSMHRKASFSLSKPNDEVGPYMMALYAKLESEGAGKAAEFVSGLDSNSIKDVFKGILMMGFYPAIAPIGSIAQSMDVTVNEFGIDNDEQEAIVHMLQNEQASFDNYMRKYLQNAGTN